MNFPAGAKPGMEIIVTGHIGLEGTGVLATLLYDKLTERFPAAMVRRARDFGRALNIHKEEEIIQSLNISARGECLWQEVKEGGIFTALWEMAAASNVGIRVGIKDIPVRQETIEICEYAEVHPYRLLSGGCVLLVCEDAIACKEAFLEQGIPAAVVGRITDDNKCILFRDGEESFLERHAGDELKSFKKRYRIRETGEGK